MNLNRLENGITEKQEIFFYKLAEKYQLLNRKPHMSKGRMYYQIYPKNTPENEGTGGCHYEFHFNKDSKKLNLYLHVEKQVKKQEELKNLLDVANKPLRVEITDFDDEKIASVFDKMINKYENKINEFYSTKNKNNGEEAMPNDNKTQPLNQILYGPPGTGKTYNTINKAIEIIENRIVLDDENREDLKAKFEEYKKAGQIEFVTFHQSYGYEEFVEGIKAKTTDKGIEYKIEAGIFKKLAKIAKENFENSKKTNLELKQEKSLKQKLEIFLNDALENGTEFFKTKGGKFKIIELSQDEITVFAEDSNYSDKKLSMPIDEFYKILESNFEIKTSRQMAKDVFNINNQRQRDTYYFALSKKFHETKIDEIVEVENEEPLKNYILIIDEINRGNISKIFGELITLIEPSKRIGADEEIKVKLPYSNDDFGVPSNLYIIGTMNTADRSIALMDTALRRRFDFSEMMPQPDLLSDFEVAEINIKSMLEKINKRVEYLYDRDHTIGHAYFMSLKENPSLGELENIFRNKIIPLLQEYFYDDWEKIRLVLGDNQKEANYQFIKIKKDYDISKLFGNSSHELLDNDETKIYEINNNAFKNIECYKKIYETK